MTIVDTTHTPWLPLGGHTRPDDFPLFCLPHAGGGCAAPHCPPADEPVVTRMARVEVVRMLRRLGGTPDWLLEDPNLLDLILPAVRSDFPIKESYGYVSGSALLVPVTVVSSTEEKAAPHDLQARWVELTTGQFRLYTLTGGHFAVFEQANLTRAYLTDALRAWL